jgi:hypothetical protein
MLGFFGALAIWQGVQLLEGGLILAWLAIIVGAVLVLAAIATAIWPSPATMFSAAVAFGLIAVWDLLLAVLSQGGAAHLAVWGVIEICIAGYLVYKLPGFYRMARNKPAKEVLDRLDDICKEIQNAKPKEDPDVLEFSAGWGNRWRIRLGGVATFVEAQKANDVVFATPEDLSIEDRTKPGKEPKKRPVTIRAGDREWQTKMIPEHLQRLSEWQEEQAASAEPEQAPEAEPESPSEC